MRIAVIGAGSVGSALGKGWGARGHEISYGVRDPSAERVRAVVEATEGARALTPAEACAGAEVVVLATPWGAAEDAVRSLGPLDGRILVDCTNPLKPELEGLAVGHDESAAERIASWADGAKVVKAFNTTGANNMERPRYGDRAVAMFVCGDDERARRTVLRLAQEIGFDPVDAGPLAAARYLEPAAMLWIHLAYRCGMGREFGFALLRR